MTCREMEHRIALHVSGDLDPGDERLVLEHMRTCGACARLSAELRAALEDMRALRGEGAGEAAMAAVRRSVLAEVESRQTRTLSRVAWILALSNLRWAAAAVAVFVVALASSHWVDRWKRAPESGERAATNVAGRDAAGVGITPPASEIVPPVINDREVRAETATRQPAAIAGRIAGVTPPPPAPQNPPPKPWIEIVDSNASSDLLTPPATLVKLMSSDPSVVLYWLVESDGG